MRGDKLWSTIAEIERLVGEMVGGADRKKETFAALFEMDNEIGRRARTSPDAKRNLTPVQQSVNALTVAVKISDPKLMKESIALVREALTKLEDVAEDHT